MDKARITLEEFSKIEVKIGTVQSAERVPETDKLLRLVVNFNEETGPRQIISGIAMYVSEIESLIGRQLAFVTNLEPRTIRGLESNGMLFRRRRGRHLCISHFRPFRSPRHRGALIYSGHVALFRRSFTTRLPPAALSCATRGRYRALNEWD